MPTIYDKRNPKAEDDAYDEYRSRNDVVRAIKQLDLTKLDNDQKSLLLYLESVSVDLGGRLDSRKMNDTDWENMAKWDAEGYLTYGRIVMADHNSQGTMWVELTEEAIADAQTLRRERLHRMAKASSYKRTQAKHYA